MAKRTIIFWNRLKDGAEQQVTENLKNIFPNEALRQIDGIEKVTICQGNGIFSAVVEYDGDFEQIFASYISNPAVQAFHSQMANYLENPPSVTRPADLPIMGDVLYWDGTKVREAVG